MGRGRRGVVQLLPGDLEVPIARRNQSKGGFVVVVKEMVLVREFLLLAVGNRRQSRQSRHPHRLVLLPQSRQSRLRSRYHQRRYPPLGQVVFGSSVACQPETLIRSIVLLNNYTIGLT